MCIRDSNKAYDEWLKAYEEMIQKTDTAFGSWTIVEATDKEYARVKIISTVVEIFADRLAKEEAKAAGKAVTGEPPIGESSAVTFGSVSYTHLDVYKRQPYE